MPNEQKALSAIVSGGLRSIAASFPVLASLGQAWSEYENYQTGQRINELIENLKIRLEAINTKIDSIEQVSQQIRGEFPSLLEIAIEKVRKEFSAEKRKIYADVLSNLLFKQSKEFYEDKVSVLHSLDALNPKDLEVLKLFRRKEEIVVKNLNWKDLNLNGDDNQKFAELVGMLAKLESRGLIVRTRIHLGAIYLPRGMNESIARLSEAQYLILPLGKKLLSTLE